MPIKIAADDILSFFFFFLENTRLDILCDSSIYEMSILMLLKK